MRSAASIPPLGAVKYLVGEDEPEIKWDTAYSQRGEFDRNIALRNAPGGVPVEDRMNIVSNRVHMLDTDTNTTHRLESDLEARAFIIFKSDPTVVGIRTQFLVWYQDEDGIWREHYFDLCVEYENGCRALFAIRHEDAAAPVEAIIERIRNQELHKHAHYAFVLTERELSKPAVNRASRILRAREVNNEKYNLLVLETLKQNGGRARVGAILAKVSGLPVSLGTDAIWALIDQGRIAHDHPAAYSVDLNFQSWICIVEGEQHVNH